MMGWPVWLIAIALSVASLALYAAMAKQERLAQLAENVPGG